ncbi:MAG: nicotinate (nicotinamide) nucleotide adenylyltransferase [Clostridia bacterium]|nr:nicotinate (nicotinamide) nucleotide adenylyltransferase [Clostridia bacterium]
MKKNNVLKKIGVFGGSFDPVHCGHVAVAKSFIQNVGLDLLYIVPTCVSPLKNALTAPAQDRVNMLKIAFADTEKAVISDIELRREGVSYTCETVAQLRGKHPKSRIYYLIGDDWLAGFTRWKDYGYILQNVRLTVANRSGRDLSAEAREFYRLTGKRPLMLKNEVNVVSSCSFRENRDFSLLPPAVSDYIKERGLYE